MVALLALLSFMHATAFIATHTYPTRQLTLKNTIEFAIISWQVVVIPVMYSDCDIGLKGSGVFTVLLWFLVYYWSGRASKLFRTTFVICRCRKNNRENVTALGNENIRGAADVLVFHAPPSTLHV